MNLVACEFGLRTLAGDHDGAALGVDLDSVLVGGFERQEEQRPQHFDHVIIRVIVVVEQDDVIERFEALGVLGSGFWSSGGGWQPFKW